jgi:hypothetical protein
MRNQDGKNQDSRLLESGEKGRIRRQVNKNQDKEASVLILGSCLSVLYSKIVFQLKPYF